MPKQITQIIIITGPSGAGKTTLGNQIKATYKDLVIIDADDIDDASFIELYNDNKQFRNMVDTNDGDPQTMHEKRTLEKRNRIIAKNHNKTIVFIGFTVPLNDLEHIGYFIDVPIDINFKRVSKRTLNDICKNANALEVAIDTDKHLTSLSPLFLFKYKIRSRFPYDYDRFVEYCKKQREDAINLGYKVLPSDGILEDLQTVLDKNRH